MKFILFIFMILTSLSLLAQDKLDADVSTSENACFKPCSKGFKSERCLSCLRSEGYSIKSENIMVGEACFKKCTTNKGIDKKSCAKCLEASYGIKKVIAPSLDDCSKSFDGQKIICSDGEYVKSGAVSATELNSKIEKEFIKKPDVTESNSKQE